MNARMAEIAAALADLRVRADALLAETAEGGGALAELPAGLEAYERQANKVADLAALGSAQALRMIVDADALYADRSEEHTSELQSLMRTSYAVFCLNKKTN